MPCIIAFIILSITGIFSASHRELAKEAFQCVFKRLTFKPCDTSFGEKIKARLVGRVLIRSTFGAKILNKHFELFSWILMLTMLVSTLWVGRGLYNYYFYGSCNGVNASGFCALDPTGENNKTSSSSKSCSAGEVNEVDVTLDNVDLSLFPTKLSQTATKDKVVLIGCYGCQYTRKTYPLVKKLISENSVEYVFAHYPVKDETLDLLPLEYCAYKLNQDKFWEFTDILFSTDEENLKNPEYAQNVLQGLGYKAEELNSCTAEPQTKIDVAQQRIELEKTNIYGTPIVFINGKGLVGPKPYRVYKLMLSTWRFW